MYRVGWGRAAPTGSRSLSVGQTSCGYATTPVKAKRASLHCSMLPPAPCCSRRSSATTRSTIDSSNIPSTPGGGIEAAGGTPIPPLGNWGSLQSLQCDPAIGGTAAAGQGRRTRSTKSDIGRTRDPLRLGSSRVKRNETSVQQEVGAGKRRPLDRRSLLNLVFYGPSDGDNA